MPPGKTGGVFLPHFLAKEISGVYGVISNTGPGQPAENAPNPVLD
jgi:hypothetical protein